MTSTSLCKNVSSIAGFLHTYVLMCAVDGQKRILKIVSDSFIEKKMLQAQHGLVMSRIGGPHLQTITFKKSKRKQSSLVWISNFTVCNSGWYSISIQSVFPTSLENWTKNTCSHFCEKKSVLLERYVWYEPQNRLNAKCTNLWSWTREPSTRVINHMGKISGMCTHLYLKPHLYSKDESVKSSLTYKYSTKIDFLVPGKNLCFVGDSQMRNLANSYIEFFNNNCKQEKMQLKKSVCYSKSVKFIGFHYPDEWKSNLVKNCKTLLINVGHWPASNRESPDLVKKHPEYFNNVALHGHGPWSEEKYNNELQKLFSEIYRWRGNKQDRRVFFVATNPSPLRGDMINRCPPGDWRFSFILEAYNNKAKELANNFNVSFIDVHRTASQLLDFSFWFVTQVPLAPTLVSPTSVIPQ